MELRCFDKLFLMVLLFLVVSCSPVEKKELSTTLDQTPEKEKTMEEYDQESLKILEADLVDPDKLDYLIFAQFSKDTLPKKIFTKSSIERLSIFRTNAKAIPSEICKLNELRELKLSMNRLNDISNLSCLRRLEYLDLSQNRIERLPLEFSEFFFLSVLDISHNRFHGDIGHSLPPNLRALRISKCELKEIPNVIFTLEYLEDLDLSSNEIKSIPVELLKLKGLITIRLEDNPIDESLIDDFREKMPWCTIISQL